MKPEEEKQSKRQEMESSAWEEMEKAQAEEGSSEMKETKGQHEEHEEQEEHKEQVIMDSRWKAFPPELHQSVLHFIPIPELCRIRTVSRDWNNIPKQLSFASQSRPQEATFTFRTMDSLYVELAQETTALSQRRWQIYDPNTQKSFKLSMEFLYEGVRDRFDVHDHCVTLAADKGFVVIMWNSASPNPRKAVQIANPITRSVVEIPPLPPGLSVNTKFGSFDMSGIDCTWVVSLVIAEDYSAFALYYVLGRDEEDPERKRAFRFHSNVGEWREIPQPPEDHDPEYILHLDSTLFTVFWDMESDMDRPKLLAFDTERDEWSDTGVLLPRDVSGVRLATAQGRLFFFAFGILYGVDGVEQIQHGVMLVEIDVASSKCTLVATLNHSHDFNAFFEEVYELSESTEHLVMVVGCGDYIVFSCTNGVAVAYDLVFSMWCEWTENRMITSLADGINTISTVVDCDAGYGMFVTTMNLSLNPVPAIIQQASSSNV